jgi:hypothetical protein
MAKASSMSPLQITVENNFLPGGGCKQIESGEEQKNQTLKYQFHETHVISHQSSFSS